MRALFLLTLLVATAGGGVDARKGCGSGCTR